MTNITDDILAAVNANQSVYSAAYNEGVKAGVLKCLNLLFGKSDNAEELIAEASALLNGIRKGRE